MGTVPLHSDGSYCFDAHTRGNCPRSHRWVGETEMSLTVSGADLVSLLYLVAAHDIDAAKVYAEWAGVSEPAVIRYITEGK